MSNSANLATREDLAVMRADLLAALHTETTRTIKWLVGVFVPAFAVTWGAIAALFVGLR